MSTNAKRPIYPIKVIFSLWLVMITLIAGFAPLSAQQTTGTIVGTVKDLTGAIVETASVQATNADTGYTRSAKTNSAGEYRIDFLPVGKYTVVAEAASFKKIVQQNLKLTVDQTLTLELTLSAGATSETVTVTDTPR